MDKIKKCKKYLKDWKAAVKQQEIVRHSDLFIRRSSVNECIDAALSILNQPSNNVVEDGCACTEPRAFEGNGVVIICKQCGLPIVDRRTT